MSATITPGVDFSALQQSVNDICNTVDALREERRILKARVQDLEAALTRMAAKHEETVIDSEGHWPAPDNGCVECTAGTVPDNLNTGLCAWHRARELLA